MRTPLLCLFDLGGVAARFLPERRLPELSRLLGAEPARVAQLIWSSGLSADFDSGQFTLPEMASRLGCLFSCNVDCSELAQIWCLAFQPREDVLGLARDIRQNAQVGLFTNNPPALEAGISVHLPALAAIFEPLLFSCSLGAKKPSTEVYSRVEQLVSHSPRELALIDDSRQNVESARARMAGDPISRC